MFGSIISWLSKANPDIVIPVVFTVGGWLWNKIRGEKQSKVERTIRGVIGSILSEVVDILPAGVSIETYMKTSRAYVEKSVWKALEKRGVPRNKTTEKVLHMLLEEATRDLGEELAAARKARLAVTASPTDAVA